MEKIYVITKTQPVNYGLGEVLDEQTLAKVGGYRSTEYCPSFKAQEAANEWIKERGERWWKVVELEIR